MSTLCDAFAQPAGETANIELIEITQPRAFGYLIGDKFERLVRLHLRTPNELDLDSLPEPGRISPSLSVEAPRIVERKDGDTTEYEITLTYQIINVDERVTDIPVPSHVFAYRSGESRFTFLVPASRIGVSVVLGRTAGPDFQPDDLPPRINTTHARTTYLSAILVSAILVLAYLYWGLPFLSSPKPFARSYREIKKQRTQTWDDETYQAVLRLIHQGFDETAGKTVFAPSLDEYFAAHTAFTNNRHAIDEFFEHSRRYFFSNPNARDAERRSYSDLSEFARQLRDLERGIS